MVHKKTKVLIAGPIAKGWMADIRRVVYPLREKNVPQAPAGYEVSGSPTFGRNKIIMDLQDIPNDNSHIFLLDADTIPPPDTILRLLSYDKDIVAPVCPMFHFPKAVWNVMAYDKDKPDDCEFEAVEYQDLPRELFRAHYLGGGALLIRKEVFEKVEWPPFEGTQDPRVKYLSEDFNFCVKAKRAGFKLWCDPAIRCMHRKHLDLLQIFDSCYKQFRS